MKRFAIVAALAIGATLFAAPAEAEACGRRAKLFGGCCAQQSAPSAACASAPASAGVVQVQATAPAAPAACSGGSCSQAAPAPSAIIPIGNKGGIFGFGILGK